MDELETTLMVNNIEVIPMIDNKPVPHGELIGDALQVISLKDLADDADVVKRNSYRNLHRPNISHLDWVSQSSSKEEAVIEKVMSYHSSRQSVESRGIDVSSHDMRGGSGTVQHHYAPTEGPIREESREMLTRTSTVADVTTQPQQQQQQSTLEYVIHEETLGELPQENTTIAQKYAPAEGPITEETTAFDDQQPAKIDQEKRRSTDRTHSGSHPTLTTQFSRQFDFGEAAETRDGGPQEIQTDIHSAWSEDAINQQESRADQVLVEKTRGLSVAEQDPRTDDIGDLEWGAAKLTREAFEVTIQRVSAPEPVPLSAGAISAAEFITLNILNHALRHDMKAVCSTSKCGPDEIKLSSALVRRVLASASSTKWSEEAVKAANLMVDDVLSTALQYVSREAGVVAQSDHVWSTDAIQVCCLIVRDLMADAERRVSSELAKQQARPGPPSGALADSPGQPVAAYGHSHAGLVDTEFKADDHDHVPASASQPAALPTVKQPVTPRDLQSQEAVPQGQERATDTQDITNQRRAPSPGQQQVGSQDRHPVKVDPAAKPESGPEVDLEPTTSQPPSEIPSADSVFSDSTNHSSDFRLTF